MTYNLLSTDRQVVSYYQSLKERNVSTIALDFEGEYNLHHYGEKLCLIQIFDGDELCLIDPFSIDAVRIRQLMEDSALLKIMYDSLSDQALLQKTVSCRITSILDLRPAADILKYEKQDLGSVLGDTLGVTIEKKKRFQRYNWTRRPIEEEALEYALSDVFHLFELKDAILRRLLDSGLMDQFMLRNLSIQNRDFTTDRKPRIFKSGEFMRLSASRRRIFERVYEVRDTHARALDLPPDSVINKAQMFGLAQGRTAIDDLAVNRRIPPETRKRIVEDLKKIL